VASSVPHQGSIARLIIGQILEELLTFLFSFLQGLTLAPPCMGLQRPKPPLRELLRQPGFVACYSIILATLVLVDLYWLARVKLARGGVILLVLFLLWPLLGFPPGARKLVDRSAAAGRRMGAGARCG
jgi:hypothetical protein